MNELNLLPAIEQIKQYINKLEQDFQKSIKPYKDSLTVLETLNTACEKCRGKGRILRSRACAEDDRSNPNDPSDYITCPLCEGSGRKAEQVLWNIH